MYTQYFGLKEHPFSLSPDPRYLYLSRRHQEALAHLTYGITHSGGFVQLTGEVGTGKTMIVRALLERLPKSIDVALVLYPYLSVREFMEAICEELGIPYAKNGDSLKVLIQGLNAYLLKNHAAGRRTVLVIDEAQNLSHEVLEQIRLLTNLETAKEKLLQFLLIGQPELKSLLAQHNLRQLAQRITARYDLKPLLLQETRDYIMHRLRVADAKAPLFNSSALHWIHRLSGGTPRLINVICDRALLGAYALGKSTVGPLLVRRAAMEINQGQIPSYRRAALAASLVITLGLVAAVIWHFLPTMSKMSLLTQEANATTATTLPSSTPAPVMQPVADKINASDNKSVPSATPPPSLAALFTDKTIATDTTTAFTQLFNRWQVDYAASNGSTACERAEKVGLRCVFIHGTWNNLRQFNRPAVIELLDKMGERHDVVVTKVDSARVSLDLGGGTYDFNITDVDPYWFGKALLLWKPPAIDMDSLRLGARGPAVTWLRQTLADSGITAALSAQGDDNALFDNNLKEQIREFQRRHQLSDDGIVGQLTLFQLSTYDPALVPPVLIKAGL